MHDSGPGAGAELVTDISRVVRAEYSGLIITKGDLKRLVNSDGVSLRVVVFKIFGEQTKYSVAIWGAGDSGVSENEYDTASDANAALEDEWPSLLALALGKGKFFASCW